MQEMMHSLNASVLERQRFQQQQQQEIINNFSLENFSSLQGEGLGGEAWPNLTSSPQYAVDLRRQQQFLTPPPTPTIPTTTTTTSNSTTSIQVGKEKTTTSSSKKRKPPIVASDDEEKMMKGDKRNEGEKQHGNKRKDSANNNSKENTETKLDYIHVRARRGQATASHSLAERVRRERISEKMKYLQDLVPGCDKITGKAGMLDEIIKYVQSLQRQVEFLSMKLAAVNQRLDFNMEALITEEMNLPCNISIVKMSPEMVDPSFPQFCSTPYSRGWPLAALTRL